MQGDHQVRFIPVSDGDVLAWGKMGSLSTDGDHHILGFKPYPGRQRGGWLIVAQAVGLPPTTRPHKRRKVAS